MRALVHEAGDQNTVTRASASEGALEVARYRRSLQSISSTVPSAPSSIAPVRLGPENTNAPAMNGLSAPSTGRNWRSAPTTPWNAGARGMLMPATLTGKRSFPVTKGLGERKSEEHTSELQSE